MNDYRVIWEIDIYAENPKQAVEKARQIQLDPVSCAVVFDVIDDTGETERVDLLSVPTTAAK